MGSWPRTGPTLSSTTGTASGSASTSHYKRDFTSCRERLRKKTVVTQSAKCRSAKEAHPENTPALLLIYQHIMPTQCQAALFEVVMFFHSPPFTNCNCLVKILLSYELNHLPTLLGKSNCRGQWFCIFSVLSTSCIYIWTFEQIKSVPGACL